jgi:hypothetical protein
MPVRLVEQCPVGSWEDVMSAGLTNTDRDALVAALLTLPVIEPGSSPQDRINAFRATLRELNRQGGTAKQCGDAQGNQGDSL